MERLGERLGQMSFEFDSEAFEEHMEQLEQKLQEMEFHFDSGAFEEQMERLNERLEEMNFDEMGFHRSWGLRSGRPILGVRLVAVTPELREHLGSSANEGLLVGGVLPDSPAEEADVRVGDLIVAVDHERIASSGDLRRALREREGTIVDLEVVRDGRPLTLSVSLPERESEPLESGRKNRPLRTGEGRGALDA
jgi:C-terminal processing protease CtpA/Prc